MRGRKPIDLEMQGGKTNRQRVWEVLRANGEAFTLYLLIRLCRVDEETVRTFILALQRGGWIEVVSGQAFEERVFRLIRDNGAEAPAVKRDGSPSTAGHSNEAMWRALRILGEVDADELAAAASTASPTAVATASKYLLWLNRAGYVVVTRPSKPGTKARYRLAAGKNTGPKPPMIQRIGQVFDANLGQVVYRQPEPELEA